MKHLPLVPICLAILLGLCSPYFAVGQDIGQDVAEKAVSLLQADHVEGNVPPANKFFAFLQRDLTGFFSQRFGSDIQVSCQLLRSAPTQTGVAYPKYYAWVSVIRQQKVVVQGAARLAAIDKTHFEVTHFCSAKSIAQAPADIKEIFPAPLCPDILERAGVTNSSI